MITQVATSVIPHPGHAYSDEDPDSHEDLYGRETFINMRVDDSIWDECRFHPQWRFLASFAAVRSFA